MDLQEYEEEETCKHCSELEKENAELKQQLLDLKQVKAQLLDDMNHLKTRKVTTYVDGKYTDDIQICVMELLLRNVGIIQVEPVNRALMNMCKMNCDRLPRHKAIDDMLIESQSCARFSLQKHSLILLTTPLILMAHQSLDTSISVFICQHWISFTWITNQIQVVAN